MDNEADAKRQSAQDFFFPPKTNINLNEIKVEKWVLKLGTFTKSKQTMDLKYYHY